ncbi:MAG TPA: hypothetical protein VM406_05245 [Noviherbaspirillum sp.]|nr:hypothetical protein [Noviherbaspirillum sp.]
MNGIPFAPALPSVRAPGTLAAPRNAALRCLTGATHNVNDAVGRVPCRRLFYSDAGLGANNAKSDRHFIRHQLSTDTSSTVRNLFKFDVEDAAAKREAYREAYRKVHGRVPQNHEIMEQRPWEVLKFADRGVLDQAGTPYVRYYRQAVETAQARGGKVHFYLGGFDAGEYVSSIVRTEARERKPFADYAANVDFNTLVGAGPHGNAGNANVYLWDSREGAAGSTPLLERQPKITTIELYDATCGEFIKAGRGFHYYAENDVRLDTDCLLALQARLLEQARRPENAALLLDGQEMAAPGRALLAQFQRYLDIGRTG